MSVVLDTKIDITKIMKAVEGFEKFRPVLFLGPDKLAPGIQKKENFFFEKEIDVGDLDSIFGFKIAENPVRWALVWGGGYSTQLNLYADVYDLRYVDHYAALGLMVVMQCCEPSALTRQSGNLIMKAREKASELIRSQPDRLEQDFWVVSEQLALYKERLKLDADRLEADAEALRKSIGEKLESRRLELRYTEEQRKANKARASAIRLKARTMSFVDKRSIR